MKASRQNNKQVRAAIEGIQPAIKILREVHASCMEQVVDNCGIVCERWLLPNGRHVIVFGTPHWRDVFYPTVGEKWADVEATLRQFIVANPAKMAYGSMQVADESRELLKESPERDIAQHP